MFFPAPTEKHLICLQFMMVINKATKTSKYRFAQTYLFVNLFVTGFYGTTVCLPFEENVKLLSKDSCHLHIREQCVIIPVALYIFAST